MDMGMQTRKGRLPILRSHRRQTQIAGAEGMDVDVVTDAADVVEPEETGSVAA